MHYLYRILNHVNQKNYIGQSIEPHTRWLKHKSSAKHNPTQVVHDAIAKYGSDNFSFEIIATCVSQDDINYIEEYVIKQYESHISTGKGYNVSFGGNNAPKSEEWKEKMRQWHASMSLEDKEIRYNNLTNSYLQWRNDNPDITQELDSQNTKRLNEYIKEFGSPNAGNVYSEERCKQMSETTKQWYENNIHPFLGKHHSEESNEKNRQSHIGLPGPNLGKTFTEEHCKKLSVAKLGVERLPFTEETKSKMSEAAMGNTKWLGKKHKPETIEKLKNKVFTEEHRAKLSAAKKLRDQLKKLNTNKEV